ncbi:TPA: hypothetical protein JD037_04665 [Raoultella ornithinolytica]|nr:hypothetical protein [Raoultella ornithinolytica]
MNTGWRDSGETPRWRCAYRGYGIVRSGSPDKAHRAAIRETPRWRCAYRGYGVVRSGSPDKALAPLSGKLPGGAALTGATGLCGRVARIRRWRRYPGTRLAYFASVAKRANTLSKIASPFAICSALMVQGGTT